MHAFTPVAQDALDPIVALRSCTARPLAILLIESDKRVDAAIPNRAGERGPRLVVVLTVFRYVAVLLDMIGSVWHVLRLLYLLLFQDDQPAPPLPVASARHKTQDKDGRSG